MGDRYDLIRNCIYCNEPNECWFAPTCNSLTFTCEKCKKENFITTNLEVKKIEDVTYEDVYWAINNASNMMDEEQIKNCADDFYKDLKKQDTLYANCSEVICKLPVETKEEALNLLKEVGIYEVKIPQGKWYDWIEYDEKEEQINMLLDKENPNLPDFNDHATLKLRDDENGYGVNGVYIEGDQHCQHQLFPTMKKIEDKFEADWEGQDGGSTNDYEDWLDESKEIPNYNANQSNRRQELLNQIDYEIKWRICNRRI